MSLLFENNCIKHETGEFYILPEYFYDEWNIRKRFWLKEEDENEIKMLLWEVYHISKWIHDMLKSGNLISSVILLRTLMERIVLFRILLKERDKISEKIKITSTAISHLFNIHIKKELEKKWKKLISLYSVLSDYLEYF